MFFDALKNTFVTIYNNYSICRTINLEIVLTIVNKAVSALFQVTFEFERFVIDLDKNYFFRMMMSLKACFSNFLLPKLCFKYFKAAFELVGISFAIYLKPTRAIFRISFHKIRVSVN